MSKLTIWNGLRARGFSKKATAAIMGNMQEESTFFAPRVQGDFTSGYTKSITYTNQVDNGIISRSDFINKGPGGGGYGLVQWTYYTRKTGLYDLAKQMQVSIGDENMQLDYLVYELNQPEYRDVLSVLNSDASLYDMTVKFLHKYENPADQSQSVCNLRTANAQEILNMYGDEDSLPDIPPDSDSTPVPVPPSHDIETCVTEHRVLYSGDLGLDVVLLQTALMELGYDLEPYGADGAFGKITEQMLKKFQADCNIRVDGIAGEETWQIIFQ